MSAPDKQPSEPVLGARHELLVGNPTVVEASSPDGRFSVVFEDDEQTGYFYARDFTLNEAVFFSDALHIYSVEGVTDRHIPSVVHILWSRDSTKACLIINGYPHAIFDFASKRSYSRDLFPDPSPECEWTHHAWDDSLRGLFFS
jgi:hypothetical protein